MIDPFVLTVAFLPLIGYLLLLSLIRVSGRVLVTTGGRDMAAVLFAVAGMIAIGPMQLFFPGASAIFLGPYVWLPLLLLYVLVCGLIVLTREPRLVVYGRTAEELYPALMRAAQAIDSAATGDERKAQVHLPQFGAHLRIEGHQGLDCVSVLAFEPMLPLSFWNHLLGQLRVQVRGIAPPSPRRGWGALLVAIAMLVLLVRSVMGRGDQFVEGFRDWLIR
ncbi:putative transmembrane protein [Rhodopirellula islandica]|uniref:Transmembrane protein n=1 Tax=Rhodopirellula islandica TaxID=595434 RepID=A0A0J1BEV6_RHOIS|nr:hypothetical protein [Rhodopirellula islandica]KLU05060.1 putative transmembrane protein [Rhodopirellula islandica]